MPVSIDTYKQLVMEDPSGGWELACGNLRTKQPMTTEHAWAIGRLDGQVQRQIDDDQFLVRAEATRLTHFLGGYYVPDLCIVPIELVRHLLATPGTFEEYADAMPFVAEVWSPSTGAFDMTRKIEQYRRRGDLEIWRIHPYERTVTAWRRQTDGSYTEHVWTGGSVALHAVPNVTIDIDRLFQF